MDSSPGYRKMMDAKKRRMSVVDKFAMTENYIRVNFRRLTEIWDEVEMPENMRYERTESAFKHIENLVDQLVDSEEQMLDGVKEGIQEGLLKIDSLCTALGAPAWYSSLRNPSISLRRAVNQKLAELTEQFEERKAAEMTTYEALSALARKLDQHAETEDYILLPDQLLPQEQLNLWRAKLLEMETTLSHRCNKAKELQEDLKKWSSVLPGCSGDVVLLCNIDLDGDDAVFSSSLLSSISDNHSEVQEIYAEWISSQQFAWDDSYATICELWGKCHVPLEDRRFISDFDPKVCNFNEITCEIKRLECIYSARKVVYDLVQLFKDNWNKKIELEQKKKDPNYYKSREKGHNVTNDLKLEKSLNATVERLKHEIDAEYARYQEKHPDDHINIEGFNPIAYIDWIHQEHLSVGEQERREKQERRKLENATRSPLRSRCVTPQPLAKKANSLNSSTRPMFPPSAGTEPSIIHPTRSQMIAGPKTSSPKRIKLDPGRSTPIKAAAIRPPTSTPRRRL